MRRYLILIEFTPNDLRLAMYDEDLPAIYPSVAVARQEASKALWRDLRWWIIDLDGGKIYEE